jgi:hypothetical protein
MIEHSAITVVFTNVFETEHFETIFLRGLSWSRGSSGAGHGGAIRLTCRAGAGPVYPEL